MVLELGGQGGVAEGAEPASAGDGIGSGLQGDGEAWREVGERSNGNSCHLAFASFCDL